MLAAAVPGPGRSPRRSRGGRLEHVPDPTGVWARRGAYSSPAAWANLLHGRIRPTFPCADEMTTPDRLMLLARPGQRADAAPVRGRGKGARARPFLASARDSSALVADERERGWTAAAPGPAARSRRPRALLRAQDSCSSESPADPARADPTNRLAGGDRCPRRTSSVLREDWLESCLDVVAPWRRALTECNAVLHAAPPLVTPDHLGTRSRGAAASTPASSREPPPSTIGAHAAAQLVEQAGGRAARVDGAVRCWRPSRGRCLALAVALRQRLTLSCLVMSGWYVGSAVIGSASRLWR